MATHSSILAWRIPWIEEPGGLHSLGSQRVGHDWSDFALMHGMSDEGSESDFLLYFHMAEEARELYGVFLFVGTLIPFLRAVPSWSNLSQRPHLQWEINISTREFGGAHRDSTVALTIHTWTIHDIASDTLSIVFVSYTPVSISYIDYEWISFLLWFLTIHFLATVNLSSLFLKNAPLLPVTYPFPLTSIGSPADISHILSTARIKILLCLLIAFCNNFYCNYGFYLDVTLHLIIDGKIMILVTVTLVLA